MRIHTNFNSTLSAGTADAADITAWKLPTALAPSMVSLTAINGTAAAVVQAIADLDTDPTNFNSTLSAGSAAAADITAIEAANGTGTINGSALTAITGTAAAVVQAIADLDTDPTNFNSTLSLELLTLRTSPPRGRQWHRHHRRFCLTAINGTAAAVVQAIADSDTDPTNFNSTLSLLELLTLQTSRHRGRQWHRHHQRFALTAINGTYAQIAQALTDLGYDPTNFNSTLSAGAEDAADITALEAANGTGTIDGSALTDINGTAAAVVQAARSGTDPTNFNSTLSAGAADAADITTIEAANGTGTINGLL